MGEFVPSSILAFTINYFFISLFQVLLKVVNQNKIDEIQLRH